MDPEAISALSETVTSSLPCHDIESFDRLFASRMDLDGDGQLSAAELKTALEQVAGLTLTGAELDQLMHLFDTDRSGSVSAAEIRAVRSPAVASSVSVGVCRRRQPSPPLTPLPPPAHPPASGSSRSRSWWPK